MGGFVDIGDLVANSETGASACRSGGRCCSVWSASSSSLEMAGRAASVTKRATFDLVRRASRRATGLINLGASFFITMLTLIAEVAWPSQCSS